jgi:AraC family ethanolamine operon transcriptional activator
MRSQVFHDFDAFAESVRDVDSKMLLRNPKERVWTTSSVDLGPIDVQFAKLGSGNIAQGQLRSDGYMLYLPLTKGIEHTANGAVLQSNSFAILEPGCEFCVSTKVEHDWCGAFIPANLLEDGADLTVSATKACRGTRPNRQAVDQFRAALFQIFTAANNGHFEQTPAATSAAQEVLKIANLVVGAKQTVISHHEGRPNIPRREIIRSSLELLDQQPNTLLSVRDLAAAASVSERTLRAVFNEYFGVGPVRYLQLRRLHQIHRVLKSADPKAVSVGQVLVDHGEWALGRFASRYRQLFGELPSETLRRKQNGVICRGW